MYGTWRTDKEKEPGFSHELISVQTKNILDQTDLDTLEGYPFPGMDTCYKIIQRNVQIRPNADFIGTRVGDKFEWVTWKELDETCEALSYAIKNHGFTPEVEHEGRPWKFMGIQAKNRKEWQYTNLSGMYQNVCSIAFYDTLGTEATRFMCNQTQLTTIAMALDQVDKFAKLKSSDMTMETVKMATV